MKWVSLVLIALIIFIGCKNNTQNTINKSVRSETKKEIKPRIETDSVRIVANKILEGESIWGNNENYIFPIMEGLTNKDPYTRKLSFQAFGKIMEQADGYVAEALGLFVLKSFEFDPVEFIVNSKLLSDSTFKAMGYEAGIEISLSNEPEPEKVLNDLISLAKEKTKGLGDLDKAKLQLFFEKLKEGFDSGNEI